MRSRKKIYRVEAKKIGYLIGRVSGITLLSHNLFFRSYSLRSRPKSHILPGEHISPLIFNFLWFWHFFTEANFVLYAKGIVSFNNKHQRNDKIGFGTSCTLITIMVKFCEIRFQWQNMVLRSNRQHLQINFV